VYAADLPEARKRAEKVATFAAMQAGYEREKTGEPGLAGYERWFAGYESRGPNNASVTSAGLYSGQLPAFRALLAEQGGDLPRFYARVRELAALPRLQRDAALAAAARIASTEQ
jgi:predicted aminopeptidase